MDSSYIDLKGSTIEQVKLEGEQVRIRFSEARIIRTMTGSKERTLWRQVGELVIGGVVELTGAPADPVTCAGGDIDENVYTYRDMIPIPFESRGRIQCSLKLEGREAPLNVVGSDVVLSMEDVAKYIKHLAAGETA